MLVIGLCKPAGFESHGLEATLFLRPKDVYKVDLLSKTSLFTNSLNFSSNNPNIELPGIARHSKEPVIQSDLTFTPRVFKSSLLFMYDLEENGKTFRRFLLDSNKDYKQVFSTMGDFLDENTSIICVDTSIGNIDMYYVLCYDQKQAESQNSYMIFGYSIFDDTEKFSVTVPVPRLIRPALKIVAENSNEKAGVIHIMILDKKKTTDKPDPRISDVFIVPLTKVDETPFKVGAVQRINVSKQVLGNSNPLDLHNIMMSRSKDTSHMVFWIGLNSRQQVFSCNFSINASSPEISLEKCALFVPEDVTNFFYKNGNYVYSTANKVIAFGSRGRTGVKKGVVQDSWKVSTIQLNKDKAVVIMKIDKVMVYFLYNYDNGSFYFAHEPAETVKSFYLFNGDDGDKQLDYLVYFYKNGFKVRDVSINPYLVVRAGDVDNRERIKIFLDDQMVANLIFKSWDEHQVVDVYDRNSITIVRNDNGEFKTKLGFAASNLAFETDPKAVVLYFNSVSFKVKGLTNYANKPVIYFSTQGRLYAIFEKEMLVIDCPQGQPLFTYECEIRSNFTFKQSVSISDVEEISEFGETLIVTFKSFTTLAVIDVNHEIAQEYNIADVNTRYCKVDQNIYFCIVGNQPNKIETLTAYKIEKDKLTEINSFSKDFTSQLAQTITKTITKDFQGIEIVGFDRGYTNSTKLTVTINVIKSKYTMNPMAVGVILNENMFSSVPLSIENIKIISKEIDDTDLKKSTKIMVFDSQLVLLNYEPAFKVQCYDNRSTYNLEYVNTNTILQTVVYKPLGVLGIMYRELESSQTYMVLYKITENAVKQLVANYKLENYTENSRIDFFIVKENQLMVVHYHKLKGDIIDTRVYFCDGPIFKASNDQSMIKVNGVSKQINYNENAIFNISEFRYVKANSIEVDTNKMLTLKLSDFVRFEGNLLDVQNDIKETWGNQVHIEKPLTLHDEINLYVSKKPFANKDKVVIKVVNNTILLQTEDRSKFKLFVNYQGKITSNTIEFSDTEGNECTEVFQSKKYLFCYWLSGTQAYLNFKNMFEAGEEQTLELARPAKAFKIIEDNANELIFVHQDIHNKYLEISRFDRKLNKWRSTVLNKRALNVTDLHVTGYHVSQSTQKDRLTVLMYDGISNNLLFYLIDLNTVTPFDILQKFINLDDLQFSFGSFMCKDMDQYAFEYYCTLFGDSSFYRLRINLNLLDTENGYQWKVNLVESFKNGMFERTFQDGYKLLGAESKHHLFVIDQNVATKDRAVHMYKKDSKAQFSKYMLRLDPDSYVVGMTVSSNNVLLNLYIVKNKALVSVSYKISDYVITIMNPLMFIGKNVDLEAQINSKKLKFKLALENTDRQDNEVVNPMKRVVLFLTFAIVFVTVLIFAVIAFIVVIIRDHKRLMIRQTTMHHTHLGIGMQDESFRAHDFD